MQNINNINKKHLITIKEVEQIYGIKAHALSGQRYYRKGLPFYKFGNKVLYAIEEIEEALKLTNIHGAWFKHHPRRKLQASSPKRRKLQATSLKPQAASSKRQAASGKLNNF